MPQFRRQHGFDFVRVQAREKVIEKNNTPCFSEAGEIGVAVCRTFGSVHHEQAAKRKTAALHERADALRYFGIVKRGEFIEQRGDDGGKEPQNQEVEENPYELGRASCRERVCQYV